MVSSCTATLMPLKLASTPSSLLVMTSARSSSAIHPLRKTRKKLSMFRDGLLDISIPGKGTDDSLKYLVRFFNVDMNNQYFKDLLT